MKLTLLMSLFFLAVLSNHAIAFAETDGMSGDIKVAVIEFKYENDPRIDFYYEFYCNINDCIFRTPDQDSAYYIDWCGPACKVDKKSFFDVFNNPEGITNIYPIDIDRANYSYYSIYKIKEFYEKEAKRYNVGLNLSIDVKGPYNLLEKPPKRLRDELPIALESFFDNESKKQNIDLSAYDIVNYVYFTSENYMVSTAWGKKTLNQVLITFDSITDGDINSISTIAHEMGHTFGAPDTYIPGTWPCMYPEGYPEPNKTPLHPQNYACIMCKMVMIGNRSPRIPVNFSEIIVCDSESKTFKWTILQIPQKLNGCPDLNADGVVDVLDASIVGRSMNTCSGSANYNSKSDITGDSCVNQTDIENVNSKFGQSASCARLAKCPDINSDRTINALDASVIGQSWFLCNGQDGYNSKADVSADGCVDNGDMIAINRYFGKSVRDITFCSENQSQNTEDNLIDTSSARTNAIGVPTDTFVIPGAKNTTRLSEAEIVLSESIDKDIVKIELKGSPQKPIYSVKATKKVRFLYIFRVSMDVEKEIDAETGQVISEKKPWWTPLTVPLPKMSRLQIK